MAKKITDPIALRDTAVDGKHFARGDKVTDVDVFQLQSAQNIGAVSRPGEDDGAAEAAIADAAAAGNAGKE